MPAKETDTLDQRFAPSLPGLLGLEFGESRAGYVYGRMEIKPHHMAPNGFLHAASVIALADSACGRGAFISRPAGATGFTTIELKTNFLGTTAEGVIEAEARLVHGGRLTQVWDAQVRRVGETRPLALFRCTQMMLYPKKAAAASQLASPGGAPVWSAPILQTLGIGDPAMNRTLVIGGVVAVAALLGLAAWLLWGGKPTTPTGVAQPGVEGGPIALNLVTVVTDHAANEADEGRKLNVSFPNFELAAKSGQTTSAVFSTTWRLKLGPDERAVVAAAKITGFMKSAEPAPAAPPPTAEPAVASTPAPAPPAESTPATEGAPAEGTATAQPPATPPTEPAPPPPPPAGPIAGDGVARVVVTIGNETFVTEWMDATGEGASHRVAKAAALTESPIDMRNGSTIPVSVTLELSGGHEAEATAKINSLELQLFAERAPQSAPPAEPAPSDGTATPPPSSGGTTP